MQPGYPPPAAYPYAPPPPPRAGGFPTWAWVLLLTLIAVVVLGVAVVLLAVVGVQSYASKAKTVEATNSVGQISRSAVNAYEAKDYVTGATHQLCPSASHPVPSSIAMVRGVKYQSSHLEWMDGSNTGWDCLTFEMMAPQYYQYDYHATGKGTSVGDRFTAEARGDLDGDGKTSHFSMDGEVSASKRLDLAPTVSVTDEKE